MRGDLAQGSRHLAFQAIYVRGNSRQKSNGAPLPFKCSYQPMRFHADASVVSFLCINHRPATSHLFGLPCWGHRACHVYRSRCVFLPSYTYVCTITSLHGCTVDSIRLHVGRKYHIQIPEPHQLRPMPMHSR